MSMRSQIQKEDECFWIKQFLRWHSSVHRSRFHIVCRPDPPDAIIQTGRVVRWIEVGVVYFSRDWARDLYTYATPGESYQPAASDFLINPDQQFSSQFASVLKKKLEKKIYLEHACLYGPGYLVLPVRYPLFNGETWLHMRSKWETTTVENSGAFRSVFVGCYSQGRIKFHRWALA